MNEKSIYDPCPDGWRIPEKSLWVDSLVEGRYAIYDSLNQGLDASNVLNSSQIIWYPACGQYRNDGGGVKHEDVGFKGRYWNANSNNDKEASAMYFDKNAYITVTSINKAHGLSVRCQKE